MIFEHLLNIGLKNLLNISQLSDFFFVENSNLSQVMQPTPQGRGEVIWVCQTMYFEAWTRTLGKAARLHGENIQTSPLHDFLFHRAQMQEIAPATGRVRQIKADNYFSQLCVCSMHSRVGEWIKRKEEAVKILQSIQKSCVKCTRGQKTWLICVPRRSGWVNWV